MENKVLVVCPHCGKSYYSIVGNTSTCMYFEPIIRDGVNINTDRNIHTTTYKCHECGCTWEVKTNGEDTEIINLGVDPMFNVKRNFSNVSSDYSTDTIYYTDKVEPNKVVYYSDDDHKLYYKDVDEIWKTSSTIGNDYNDYISKINSYDNYKLPDDYDDTISKINNWSEILTDPKDVDKYNLNSPYLNKHSDFTIDLSQYANTFLGNGTKDRIDIGGIYLLTNKDYTEEQIKNIEKYFGWKVIK